MGIDFKDGMGTIAFLDKSKAQQSTAMKMIVGALLLQICYFLKAAGHMVG